MLEVIRKLFLYIFGAYNLVFGLTAVLYPPLAAAIFAVPSITPEWSAAARWIGALAIAIAYAAYAATKSGGRELINILLISALMTLIASIFSLFAGEASMATLAFDMLMQALLIIILVLRPSP